MPTTINTMPTPTMKSIWLSVRNRAAYSDPDTRPADCLCACAQGTGPVRSGTAQLEAGAYTCIMQLVSIKPVIAVLWVSAVFVLGIAGSMDSLSSWTVLTGVAVVSPVVMMWRWNDPRQTMSESISEALR